MIIDLILNRKDRKKYNAKTFYNEVINYGEIGNEIANALDNYFSSDIQYELCKYVVDNKYDNIDGPICSYIRSVNWL